MSPRRALQPTTHRSHSSRHRQSPPAQKVAPSSVSIRPEHAPRHEACAHQLAHELWFSCCARYRLSRMMHPRTLLLAGRSPRIQFRRSRPDVRPPLVVDVGAHQTSMMMIRYRMMSTNFGPILDSIRCVLLTRDIGQLCLCSNFSNQLQKPPWEHSGGSEDVCIYVLPTAAASTPRNSSKHARTPLSLG